VLAPGGGSDPAQIIDARDLTQWTIRLAENRTFGTFNAMGPAQPGHSRPVLLRYSFFWRNCAFCDALGTIPLNVLHLMVLHATICPYRQRRCRGAVRVAPQNMGRAGAAMTPCRIPR